MRLSLKKHPLTVLRLNLGLTRPEMADRLLISPHTLQKLEQRKFHLTKSMADKISSRSGVNAQWLLAGDPKAPVTDSSGKPYSPRTFTRVQKALREPKVNAIERIHVNSAAGELVAEMLAILLRAHNEDRFEIRKFEVFQALDEIANQFGTDSRFKASSDGALHSHFGDFSTMLREIGFLFDVYFREACLRKLPKLIDESGDKLPAQLRRFVRTIPNKPMS